jgi:hypothetical protein
VLAADAGDARLVCSHDEALRRVSLRVRGASEAEAAAMLERAFGAVHEALSGANGEDNLRVWALCPTCLDEGGEPPCRSALRREWLSSREEEKRPELRAWVLEPASEGALRCRLAPELRLASARVLWGAAAAPQPSDLDPCCASTRSQRRRSGRAALARCSAPACAACAWG